MINPKLVLGDCLEKLKEIPDESIDLVVTSPPYDNLRSYNGTNDWSFEKFKGIAQDIARSLKHGGVIVWVVNDATIKGSETGSSFRQALHFKDECGLNIHDTMIWQKDSCAFPEQTRYYPLFEYMFVFSKGSPKTFNPLRDRKNKWAGVKRIHREYDRRKGDEYYKRTGSEYTVPEYATRYNIWNYPVGAGKSTKDKVSHPAIFPEKLAEEHILSWSNPGDVVLDPFMGSGTTGKMAIKNKRKFIGIEREPSYMEISEKRIYGSMTEIQQAMTCMEMIKEFNNAV